jgi:hypothetical protein
MATDLRVTSGQEVATPQVRKSPRLGGWIFREKDMHGQIQWIGLGQLRAHPQNSNVMNEAMLGKLRRHIEQTGRYPPLIVRGMPAHHGDTEGTERAGEAEGVERAAPAPGCRHGASMRRGACGEEVYQVLDGHHRWKVLEALGHEQAACMVWEADEEQALVWLTTLNRLEGRDDPWRRAELVRQLHEQFGRSVGELAKVLPDAKGDLEKLLKVRAEGPVVRATPGLDSMRQCVSFFLLPPEARELEAAIERAGGGREEGLMKLVRAGAGNG